MYKNAIFYTQAKKKKKKKKSSVTITYNEESCSRTGWGVSEWGTAVHLINQASVFLGLTFLSGKSGNTHKYVLVSRSQVDVRKVGKKQLLSGITFLVMQAFGGLWQDDELSVFSFSLLPS